MKSKKWLSGIFVLCLAALGAGQALAHDLWLAPATDHAAVADTVKVTIGFGHKFPVNRVDEQVKPGMIQKAVALGPDGREVPLHKVSESEYTFKASAPGPYLLRALMKPGFFSRTEKGMRRGNKKEVQGVKRCMFFTMIANAPILVGPKAQGLPGSPAGQALQLVPQADLRALKQGDLLPVKVLFNGAPLANTLVRALYAGYEPPKSDPASELKPDPKLSPKEAARAKMQRRMATLQPVRVKTDAQGLARLKLATPGWWLVLLQHKMPHEDPALCDDSVFKTSYTFEVR